MALRASGYALVTSLGAACAPPEDPAGAPPPGLSGGEAPGVSGSAGGGATDGAVGDLFECGEKQLEVTLEPARAVFVIDRSGSMADPWDDDSNPATPPVPRWDSLRAVVASAVATWAEPLAVGAVVFPGSECGVSPEPDVPLAVGGGSAIVALLDGQLPFGGTPTAAGLQVAVDALVAQPKGPARFALLVTDGVPSCGETEEAIAVAAMARELHGVITFAVGEGVPEDAVPLFQELADAGGWDGGAFLNGADAAQVQAAIDEFGADVARCRVALEFEPERPEDLEIRLDGQTLPRVVPECGNDPGWAYASPSGPWDYVELCPATCSKIDKGVHLEAIVKCPPATPGG